MPQESCFHVRSFYEIHSGTKSTSICLHESSALELSWCFYHAKSDFHVISSKNY